jgi:WD40 repeat protein
VLAISPDGKTVASGGAGPIRLWEIATGKERARLAGHDRSTVNSLVFGPDGKTLASAGADGTILLWDVDPGRR